MPCAALTQSGQDATVSAQWTALQKQVTDNQEHGICTYHDSAGKLQFASVTGQANAAGIDIASVSGQFASFTHTHYTGLLSIFSGSDLKSLWQLQAGGHMENTATFNMNLITASGTVYSLSISDLAAFQAFGQQTFETTNYTYLFEKLYANLYKIDPSRSIEQNETAFLQMLVQTKSGLTLFKGDSNDFGSWKKISYDNNTQTKSSTSCN